MRVEFEFPINSITQIILISFIKWSILIFTDFLKLRYPAKECFELLKSKEKYDRNLFFFLNTILRTVVSAVTSW